MYAPARVCALFTQHPSKCVRVILVWTVTVCAWLGCLALWFCVMLSQPAGGSFLLYFIGSLNGVLLTPCVVHLLCRPRKRYRQLGPLWQLVLLNLSMVAFLALFFVSYQAVHADDCAILCQASSSGMRMVACPIDAPIPCSHCFAHDFSLRKNGATCRNLQWQRLLEITDDKWVMIQALDAQIVTAYVPYVNRSDASINQSDGSISWLHLPGRPVSCGVLPYTLCVSPAAFNISDPPVCQTKDGINRAVGVQEESYVWFCFLWPMVWFCLLLTEQITRHRDWHCRVVRDDEILTAPSIYHPLVVANSV